MTVVPEELLKRFNLAIIDRVSLAPEPWHEELPLFPLVPFRLRSDEEKMPALLDLEKLNEEQWARVYANLQASHVNRADSLISCMLRSAPRRDVAEVAFFLANHLVMGSPEGDFFVRYYDSRVFPHMRRILAQEQFEVLYGDQIASWTIRFGNEWLTLPSSNLELHDEAWRVSSAQRQQIDRVQLINQTMKRWQELKTPEPKNPHPTEESPWAKIDAFDHDCALAEKLLIVAQNEYRLTLNEDLIQFAVHGLLYGMSFHNQPAMQEILEEVAQNQHTGYAYLTAGFNKDQWAVITAPRQNHYWNQGAQR